MCRLQTNLQQNTVATGVTIATETKMATAAVLQPSQSANTTSLPGEISQARQRRRRSTRKSEGLSRSRRHESQELQLNQGISTLTKNEAISSDEPSSVPHSTVGSVNSVLTDTASQLTETARQRRRTRLRHQRATQKSFETAGVPRPQSEDVRPLPDLEDSTANVADLLKRKLQSGESEAVSERVESSHHDDIAQEQGGGETADTEQQQQDRPLPELVQEETGSEVAERCTDILGITVHGTDHLKASVKISHPCVRVTIVDVSLDRLGDLMKKSRPDRCVTSFYERGNPNVDYILPVLTQPFNCTENSTSLQPSWEETLIFNEQLTHFTQNENVIIFFELLDFSPINSSRISRQRAVGNSEHTPWYHIAWGFLKPAGKTSKGLMGQRSRVQLYRFPKRRFRSSTESKEVFQLWLNHSRTPYPSTLYVTLNALPSESDEGVDQTQLVGRSTVPTLAEVGTVTFDQLIHSQQNTKSLSSLAGQPSALLSETARLPGQPCYVPTTHSTTLRPTINGCSSLQFSHSGRLLAVGCAHHGDNYPVIMYEVPSFKAVLVTEGHKGIVYDMCWDSNDGHLATASGDGLVKVWSMSSPSPEPAFTLPHPCYVYSVCFVSTTHIFSGAYDGNIRLWSVPQPPQAPPQLVCELRGHSGLVNCLVWSEGSLYAGDSQGEVGVWREGQGEWKMVKRINVVRACALTSMSLHPNGRKLLLHTVKGAIVMVDLRIDRVCCEYRGVVLSQSQHCSSVVSPCGGLVFAAGLPGEVHVWDTDTGKQVYKYTQELPIKSTVAALAFHPTEHVAVFSAYGPHEPIVALVHKTDQPTRENATSESKPKQRSKEKLKTKSRPPTRGLKSTMISSARLTEVTRTLNQVTGSL